MPWVGSGLASADHGIRPLEGTMAAGSHSSIRLGAQAITMARGGPCPMVLRLVPMLTGCQRRHLKATAELRNGVMRCGLRQATQEYSQAA